MLYIHKEQLFAIADFKQFDQFDYEVCEMHCIALHANCEHQEMVVIASYRGR